MLIEQALESINIIEIERSNYHAIPLGNLGEILCRLQGVKQAKSEWVNPYPNYIKSKEIKKIIPEKPARLFLTLSREGKLPRWVFDELDIELIKQAAS